MATANMVFVRLSVCLSGQKLGSAWKILPVTARSTCSCDLIVQHVRTQSLASVISAKRLVERWTKQRCATLWNVTRWKESGCQSCCCCRRRNDDPHNNRCWYCSKLKQDSKSFFSSTNSVLRQVDLWSHAFVYHMSLSLHVCECFVLCFFFMWTDRSAPSVNLWTANLWTAIPDSQVLISNQSRTIQATNSVADLIIFLDFFQPVTCTADTWSQQWCSDLNSTKKF